jgi:hypothetical protein
MGCVNQMWILKNYKDMLEYIQEQHIVTLQVHVGRVFLCFLLILSVYFDLWLIASSIPSSSFEFDFIVFQSFFDTNYSVGCVNQMWIRKNYKNMLEYIQSRSFSSYNNI